jgi:Protein of unknown function (DUF2786)
VTATATVWRTCPSCGASFGQRDDPGRKRVYCSRACQQAAYRARQRHGGGQRQGSGQHRTGRQEWRSDWQGERHQRAGTGGPGARQRQHWRQQQREQRQPPPGGADGQRPGASSGARAKVMCSACGGLRARHTVPYDQAAHQRARRRHDALLRKAAATTFAHEAAACRAKAETLRDKYGL